MGESYTVQVPDRLAADHPLAELQGDRFTLTVTGTGLIQGRQAAVAGLRHVSLVMVELTEDQNASLGLRPDARYILEGLLRDATTGEIVDTPVPAMEELTVPVRWLRERAR